MFTNRPAVNSQPESLTQQSHLGSTANDDWDVLVDVYHIRDRVQRKLLAETDGDVNLSHLPQMRQMIETFLTKFSLKKTCYIHARFERECWIGYNRTFSDLALLSRYFKMDP